MIIKSIKINNYKSTLNENNNIYFEKNITALIGKNESGKTNVLSAISCLDFYKSVDQNFFKLINKNATEKISFEVRLLFSDDELQKYNIEQEETIFDFTSVNVVFRGGLSNLIKQTNFFIKYDEMLNDEILAQLITQAKHVNNVSDSKSHLNKIINMPNQLIFNVNSVFNSLKSNMDGKHDEKEAVFNWLDHSAKEIIDCYDLLPKVFFYKNIAQLKATYQHTEIKQIYANSPNYDVDILQKFLKVAKVSIDEIDTAFGSTDVGERKKFKDKIVKQIEDEVFNKFKEFYKQEEFKIFVLIEGNSFTILFSAGDNYISLSERSNGLKWYFSFFIESLYQNVAFSDKPVLYLFDEPGVYLHVNAQKELLKLFSDLSTKGNQVLYTTHSPYMLNNDELKNIRAVQKNGEGNTEIFNVYDSKLSSVSKLETLSPLIESLGCDLKYNFGPTNQKVNIVTEGITDYYYLCAMMDYLEISKDYFPSVIPAAGASNIVNIVSILIGWGCNFFAIFDYDKEGIKEYIKATKKLGEVVTNKMMFVNLATEVDNVCCENYSCMESLICEKDFELFNINLNISKPIKAKQFYDGVKCGECHLSEYTVNNFKRIFLKINVLE